MVLSHSKLKRKRKEEAAALAVSGASHLDLPSSDMKVYGTAEEKTKRKKRKKDVEEPAVMLSNGTSKETGMFKEDKKRKKKQKQNKENLNDLVEEFGGCKEKDKKKTTGSMNGIVPQVAEGPRSTSRASVLDSRTVVENRIDEHNRMDEATHTAAAEVEEPVVEPLAAKGEDNGAATKGRTISVREKKGKKKKVAKDRWGVKIPDSTQEENLVKSAVETSGQLTKSSSDEAYDLKKVFVGGMPYYSTEQDIHDYFSECGVISELDCMTFPDTGNFRGIAFITFKTEEGAAKALKYDGADMGGRFLKIEKCKLKPRASVKNSDRGEVQKTQGCTSAYIGNLSWDITESAIKNFFTKFYSDSKVDSIRLSFDKISGEFKGFGHVDFGNDESLEAAVKLNQKELLGRPLKIAYAVPPKQGFRNGNSNVDNRNSEFETRKVGACYNCGKEGHKSFLCPQKAAR